VAKRELAVSGQRSKKDKGEKGKHEEEQAG